MTNGFGLLSTSEAARAMGVSTTSLKRWADTGLVDCVRTVGGHRRFTHDALDRFRRVQGREVPVVDEVDRWVNILLSDIGHEVALVRARARLGAWWRVADELGPVLTEIGARWARGDLSVADEHVASERLSRALARVVESLPLPPDAPTCLLACVEQEEHSLGLSLAQLCFHEAGWASIWLGPRSPAEAISDRIRSHDRIRVVGMSASKACDDSRLLDPVQDAVSTICRERDVALVLGGKGAWASEPSFAHRIFEFDGFPALERQLRGDSRSREAS